jgi:hypothetical protein
VRSNSLGTQFADAVIEATEGHGLDTARVKGLIPYSIFGISNGQNPDSIGRFARKAIRAPTDVMGYF